MSASPNSAVESFDELCNHVEHALGVKIPQYLKNILLYAGFDNRLMLRSLGESDISSLETFGKSESYRTFVKLKSPQSDFFGEVYAFQCRYFAIPPGHRKLLIHIADYLQKTQKPVKTSHE